MKYTKNFPNKLLNERFKFAYDNTNSADDDGLHYAVFRKGNIECTIEHSPERKVIFNIVGSDINLNIKSLEDLRKANQLINPRR